VTLVVFCRGAIAIAPAFDGEVDGILDA